MTTRLKVMADMNIAEHRIPQDGRISLNVGSKGIDLRMATLPTIHGEKVVMRVLDKSSVVLGFADLGFDEDLLKTYESDLHQALRHHPGHRPDRFGQVHHPVHDADRPQLAREEHHHGRGSRSSCSSRASTRCSSTSRPA